MQRNGKNTTQYRRSSGHRWRDAGWPTLAQAEAAFRAVLLDATRAGHPPGTPLHPAYRPMLEWLIAGHPRSGEMTRQGVAYFTFYETGRDHPTGRFGFSVVDNTGVEHPFSLRSALTGFDAPRFKPDPNSPFHGVTS